LREIFQHYGTIWGFNI